jgi:hypothetical protein
VIALLALVAVIVPRVGDRTGDEDSAARSASGAPAARSRGDDAVGGGGDALQDDSAGQSLARRAGDLGAVDDEAELARRVTDALAVETAAEAAPSATADACEASFRGAGGLGGSVRLRASVTWRGRVAEVVSDGERAVVVAVDGCERLADVDVG